MGLGREINMSLLSHLDVRSRKEQKSRKAEKASMHVEEEAAPLRTLSTAELEDRLKDIDSQKRVLEALRDLGGASFDLTAETPMLSGGEVRSAARGHDSGSQNTYQDKDPGNFFPVLHGEDGIHEFQRLAPTLKLGRTLSVMVEVNAPVDVPYSMLANIEEYPLWMPWCTSGKVLGGHEDGPDGEQAFDGEVGFGFETGSFLGTLGDTVHYRLFTRPPPKDLAPFDPSANPVMARVRADAVNGFTYGNKLVYDWRFTQMGSMQTKVELDLLFQARNIVYMPIWDSMQYMVINNMLRAFRTRAEELQRIRANAPLSDAAG